MSLTPVEIRHVRLPRRPFGYQRGALERLLEDIVSSFEDVWRERADQRDEIERLEGELRRHRDVEEALRNTLLSAERMADELRAQAHREADVIVAEARTKAREIESATEAERERVGAEIRRLRSLQADVRTEYRAFLLAALQRLDDETAGPREQGHQAA